VNRRRTAVLLGVILLVGAAFRIAAFAGPSFALGSDESRYIAVAQNLAHGYFPGDGPEWFGTRVVFLWPVAGLFRVFGAGDLVAALWPLLGSLIAVVAAYLIGRELRSDRVGLVAAAVVALTPIEILVGTSLRPDAIMPGLIGLAIWCALRAGRRPGWAWGVAAGALLGAAWSCRESALVMAPVVLLAGRPAIRRSLRPMALGAGAVAGGSVLVFTLGAGDPFRPLVAAGTEGEFRNPFTAFRVDTSYVATALEDIVDPGAALFLALPLLAAAVATCLVRRERVAILPGVWFAWALLYLEFGTLVNLAKPARYLTLCTIPAALIVALAVDGRFALAAPAALAAAALLAIGSIPARDHRDDDVLLVGRVADRLRDLPPGPVLSESYTWWAKLRTYTARGRIPIPRVIDPEFATSMQARARRELIPLPEPTFARGGYVVTGPIHRRSGWPTNWDMARRRIRAEVPWETLTPVARLDGATIWRWTG
jgi:4-amino-4-deoxy-L-arabinose transferase-like glycosyltransferase